MMQIFFSATNNIDSYIVCPRITEFTTTVYSNYIIFTNQAANLRVFVNMYLPSLHLGWGLHSDNCANSVFQRSARFSCKGFIVDQREQQDA
ncbi:MAG TPA: hypothetical protein DCZ49_04975 [Hyphomonadaceae bacterium]|nr:hypothetical protein [Hyphomonadaceae bacterium]